MKTQADIRNSLGDDISWKSLYAQQNNIYPSREKAVVDAILWCNNLDKALIAQMLIADASPFTQRIGK